VVQVTNGLAEDTSVHWHGVLVPFQMDGVPGISFPGIKPGGTFPYRFRTRQSGTYWYHSHSGLQEQTGVYGPIIIDPLDPDPYPYDREYVVMRPQLRRTRVAHPVRDAARVCPLRGARLVPPAGRDGASRTR